MTELYNNTVCVSGSVLIRSEKNPAGLMPKHLYDYYKKAGCLTVVRRGGREHSVLVEYGSLPRKYRAELESRYGAIERTARVKDLVDTLSPDQAAAAFYAGYRIEYADNEKGLPEEKQRECLSNAMILNAVGEKWKAHRLERSKDNKKQLLGGKFWKDASDTVGELALAYPHSLPSNPRRLRAKYESYTKEGYGALISRKFANRNTVKITPEAGEWLTAQWMSPVHRVATVEQLHELYNSACEEKGWKKLKSHAAVRRYLDRPEVKRVWYAARYGELEARETYQRQHRTLLPTRRDSLWYSDGTKLNYYYRDAEGNVGTCQVYEVMDVYSEVFLGYHISRSEDFEAQYGAYRMAIQKSGRKPYEIKYDNQGGHRKLEASDFLKNLSVHAIRTAPYNGRSKTIEHAFGVFQQQYLHRDWFFTGQNITAKKRESRQNMEFILANGKLLPTLEEIRETYRLRREEWNNAPHPKTGIPRMEMYRASVNEKTAKVTVADMIDMFGVTAKNPSTYRSSGIEIQVKNEKHAYEVLTPDGKPDRNFNRRNVGRRFYVRYRPDDMGCVSLFEKDASGELRFIALAGTYLTVHRAMQDQTGEDLHLIRQTEHGNRAERIEEEKKRNELLEKHGLHPNQHGLNVAPLKGVTTKRKKKDIGEIQKELSDITQMEMQTLQREKDARAAVKEAAAEQAAWESEQDEFTRRRLEMLRANMN